jgi:hypothetical protein
MAQVPFPATLQDAAAVYAHLVTYHLRARNGPDGKYRYPDLVAPDHVLRHDVPKTQDSIPGTSTPSLCQTSDYETRFRSCAASPGTEVTPSGEAGHRGNVETI